MGAPTVASAVVGVPERGSELGLNDRVMLSVVGGQKPITGSNVASHSYASLSDSALFQLAQQTGGLLNVGIKLPGASRGFWKGRSLISPSARQNFQRQLLLEDSAQRVSADARIPLVQVRVTNLSRLARLRRRPFVDYVEPALLPVSGTLMSNPGCGYGANDFGSVWNPQWQEAIPLSFVGSNIDQAWKVTTGAGVVIGITDTGVNPNNLEFSHFRSGLSNDYRRTFSQSTVTSDTVTCAHGTKFASIVAAPNSGRGIVGVAWNASIHSAHLGNGVFQSTGFDASGAIANAGLSGAKVISMAWGSPFWQQATADQIQYWFYNHDVVFVGAAGTSETAFPQNWVVFPARMDEVMAATGATSFGDRDPKSHYASEVDIVAYSDITSTDEGGSSFSQLRNSSAATAVVTGVAALVRARYPNLSNTGVVNRIKTTAGSACGINTSFGPIVNALAAVGSFCGGKFISGPDTHVFYTLEDAPVTLEYSMPLINDWVIFESNPAQYWWADGVQGRSRTLTVSPQPVGWVQIPLPTAYAKDLVTNVVREFNLTVSVITNPTGLPPNCGDLNPLECFGPRIVSVLPRAGAREKSNFITRSPTTVRNR